MVSGTTARELRELSGLTMGQVAERAHIDARTVFRFETGETSVSLDSRQRIVRVLRDALAHRQFTLEAALKQLGEVVVVA
jgi:transcriptional regulator with XRE-family HTH domain